MRILTVDLHINTRAANPTPNLTTCGADVGNIPFFFFFKTTNICAWYLLWRENYIWIHQNGCINKAKHLHKQSKTLLFWSLSASNPTKVLSFSCHFPLKRNKQHCCLSQADFSAQGSSLVSQSEFISAEKLSNARIYPPLPHVTVGVCLCLLN